VVHRHRVAGAARLAQSTHAVVLAGGRGTRLQQLTAWRAKPAVPFGGHLRIVDFVLSNCVNSGIRRVSVLTQYKSQSLIRHIARAWSFPDSGVGPFVEAVPAQQQVGDGWYSGTADAVFQNLDLMREGRPSYVLVLAGDHVYKMDYARLLEDHAAHRAEITVACIEVPVDEASAFGVMQVGDDRRVLAFQEKPARPATIPGRPGMALASMGIYVFNAATLYRELLRDAADAGSSHDFGKDILPGALGRLRMVAHPFAQSAVDGAADAGSGTPYWRDVGTLDGYWAASMDLLSPHPRLDLYEEAWPIRGLSRPLPPARFVSGDHGAGGMVIDSMVSGGCIVNGATVIRSLLSPRVQVRSGSLLEDSLLLPDVVVGRDVIVRRAIVDKGCVLPDGLKVGVNRVEDSARFTVTEQGITLVTPEMLNQTLHTPARPAGTRSRRTDGVAC
jgi:glucose-1-phosphate adenylyltransferase